MAYKRKRVMATRPGTWGRKRGKFSRFKGRRGRRSSTYSTKAGFGAGMYFKTKKLSRRAWSRKLWDGTLQKTHYRSNGTLAGALSSIAGQGQLSITAIQALDNGVNSFWTTAGGTVEANDAQGVPLFFDDIVIRGGMLGIKLFNNSSDTPVQIKVYLVRDAPRRNVSNLPAAAPFGWDPTIVPEFSKDIGRIIFSKSFELEYRSEMTVERRIGVHKIDQEAWATDVSRFSWIVTVGDPVAVTEIAVSTVTYWNISFSSDTIGAA